MVFYLNTKEKKIRVEPWEYHDPPPPFSAGQRFGGEGGGGGVVFPRSWGLPKGPFRTKMSTAPESVVFCYRRSFLLSVPFSCLFFLEKQALLSTIHSVLLLPYCFSLAVVNLPSVLFLVRKGPLGVNRGVVVFPCRGGGGGRGIPMVLGTGGLCAWEYHDPGPLV